MRIDILWNHSHTQIIYTGYRWSDAATLSKKGMRNSAENEGMKQVPFVKSSHLQWVCPQAWNDNPTCSVTIQPSVWCKEAQCSGEAPQCPSCRQRTVIQSFYTANKVFMFTVFLSAPHPSSLGCFLEVSYFSASLLWYYQTMWGINSTYQCIMVEKKSKCHKEFSRLFPSRRPVSVSLLLMYPQTVW